MPGWSRQLLFALLFVVAVAALSPASRAANDSGQTIQQQGNSLIDTGPSGAAILGRVIDGDSGVPLAGVTVTATGVPPSLVPGSGRRLLESLDVETTNTGQFVLANLTAGNFWLNARLENHMGGAYGLTRPGGTGRHIEVKPGERRTDVEIRLWRLGTIAGRVIDEAGEPVVGVTVRADPISRVSPTQVRQETKTDDRGYYRIAGLASGSYLVLTPQATATVPASARAVYGQAVADGTTTAVARSFAESRAPSPTTVGLPLGDQVLLLNGGAAIASAHPPPPTRPGEPLRLYPTTYHPSAMAPSAGRRVVVAAPADREDVDIRLVPVPTATVSGIVTGPAGPVQNVGVHLWPVGVGGDGFVSRPTESGTAAAVTDPAGRFVMLGVQSGQYWASVLITPRPTGDPSRTTRPPVLWARVPVTVAGADVSGLYLELRPTITISGELVFDGTGPHLELEQRRPTISLDSEEPTRLRPAVSPVDPQGRFEFSGLLPGRYRLHVGGAYDRNTEWFVRTVMLNGRDVAGEFFELDERTSRLRVVMTDRPSPVSLTVGTHPSGAAEARVGIVVIPANTAGWIAAGMPGGRVHTVQAPPESTTELSHVLPGEYIAAALPEDEMTLLTEEFVRAIARSGVRFTVVDGQRTSLSLPVVSVR